jgi:DNA helicase-2/ATP-dependent DNA helicase PcrA
VKCTIMELITDFTPIEKLLLPNGCCFANDARNVINSWNSNDILACPGSGKTTVLIAKLKLIADKSPLKDGRGVCVLSHTNVAVSELKAKLGKSAERLLSYPNFVGTIQTFVDQYITFPFLRQFANTSIQVVSDEDYANHLYSLICKTDSKLKWFIDQQYNAFGVKRYDSVVKFMANIYTDDEGGIHLSGVNRVLAGKSTNSAISYARAIQRLLSEEGLIRYNDTYRYTLLALKKYGSSLRTLLSRRFQYVFVDEYQDCSTLQRNVLDALFSGTETIFQKIGDVDQAIYNSTNDNTPVWQVEDSYMSIAHSNRYSQEIADVLSVLRTNQETIISSRGVQRIKPTLFVYDSSSRLRVIPTFIQEIQSNGLAKPEGIYKAVGMFENVSGLKISDYWPTFQKKVNQQSIVHFPDYISEISSALANGSLSLSERWIRKLLSKVLHYVGIKDEAEKEYGSISIKRYISNSFPQIYQSSILSLSQIHDFSYSAVEKKVKEIFASLLGDGWLEIIPDSFMQPVREPQVASEDSHILYDESSISIVFDTVYGVKGETHDATLYLETETKKSSDIRRILPLLERKITQCKNELQEKSRRCIYVGFSRPKYLLCLAISEKTYVGHETAFSSWKIVDLRSEDAM